MVNGARPCRRQLNPHIRGHLGLIGEKCLVLVKEQAGWRVLPSGGLGSRGEDLVTGGLAERLLRLEQGHWRLHHGSRVFPRLLGSDSLLKRCLWLN